MWRSSRRSGSGKGGTVRVYEVLFHSDKNQYGGAAGDGSFTRRFLKKSDADDFAKDKHYYGKPATVGETDAPRATARRWGLV